MTEPDTKAAKLTKIENLRNIVAIAFGTAFLFWLIFSQQQAVWFATLTPTNSPQSFAWKSCALFIEQRFGVPAADAQEYAASGVKTLDGDRYEVTIPYTYQSGIYKCSLARRENGDMELLDISSR